MLEGVEGVAFARTLSAPPAGALRHAAMLLPLGVPTLIESDSAELLAATCAAYGEARPAEGPTARVDPPARTPWPALPRVALLSQTQRAEAAPRDGPAPLRIAADRELLLLAGADAAGRASRAELTATARLAPELLAEPDRLRAVLDALVLFLLTPLDRQPVHAAAVAQGSAGLALTGRGGAGKSTLAYAALRAGLDVLGDDAVYVQLEPAARVWTLARPLHLAPEAAAWFPELAGQPAVLRANGKRRIVVPTQTPPPAVPPQFPHPGGRAQAGWTPGWEGGAEGPPPPTPAVNAVRRWGLCLLDRTPHTAAANAEPIPPDEAVARVLASLEPGFDVWRDTIGPRVAALAQGGAWRLRVGSDPRAAVDVMRELLARVAG